MRTRMAQNGQELASVLAAFSHQALTAAEMTQLYGGEGTGTLANDEDPPVYIKEE